MGTYTKLLAQQLPSEATDVSGGVSETEIGSAERAIGVRFPPKFREFLQELGCGEAGSEEFIGLGGPLHLDLVRATLALRQRPSGFPPTLMPVRHDGFGNYDCLDRR
jgi:antitoxin YobK